MRLAFDSGLVYVPHKYHPTLRAPGSGLFGLGLDPGTQQIAGIAATGAALTGSIVAMLPGFAAAGPIGAAVAGLVAVGIGIANLFKGCGQTCVEATTIANKLQTYWQNNLDHYMNAPVHYATLQKAALNNFDTGWAAMFQACSDPSLGAAGQRCISERQRGGSAPWCPTGTGCDAFVTFRDPIANDPHVVPDPVGETVDPQTGQVAPAPASSTSIFGGGTGGGLPMPLVLGGAGLLVILLMSSGGGK